MASESLALVLGGGGARAAYQVGFLRRLGHLIPTLQFPIVAGVSAGSINAAFLANWRDSLPAGLERLAELWQGITPDQVFHSNPLALTVNVCRWAVRLLAGGTALTLPARALVNTTPLRKFLCRALSAPDGVLHGVAENIRRKRLRAAAVTTTNYATGQSVTWVQGEGLPMWERPLRRSVLTPLTVDHVMASCALPLFFPAIQLGDAWHGDGGIRLTAPLSPAVHLGAQRIFIVSTRYQRSQTEADQPAVQGYPPPATVAGVLLNAVFLEMLDYDAAVAERINRLIARLPEVERMGLRPVEVRVMRPSQDLEALAADYEATLPLFFRHMVRGLGTRETRRPDLLATILFAPEYVRHVMQIGEQDAEREAKELVAFLSPEPSSAEVQTVQ
ncbi:MAG TPA: patatin-like phospholipase family protein, partial [Verrucomicrobiae bacterium]